MGLWCVWNCKSSCGYLERFLSSHLANSLLASANCLWHNSHAKCWFKTSLSQTYLDWTLQVVTPDGRLALSDFIHNLSEILELFKEGEIRMHQTNLYV